MTYEKLLSQTELFAERMVRRCASSRRIVVYGTSTEAQAILQRLKTDILSRILYIIDSANTGLLEVLGVPVRKEPDDTDGRECVVILDYLNSMLAKHILFLNEPCAVINVYDSGCFYDPQTLISDDWQSDVKSDQELVASLEENINREMIARFVSASAPGSAQLRTVEIETVNRCNGSCSFCPVNKNTDPRKLQFMSEELFEKIIRQLAQIRYSGRLALFSNNEPFLDKRLIEFHRYARQWLPLCRIHLFTNGTLLNIDKVLEIIPYLDELIIDNYSDDAQIPENLAAIIAYCENKPELITKITIVQRRENELLSTRGGEALNRQQFPDVDTDTCALPFQQMIIRPDGKVSLCCNDPLGKYTLGDLQHQTVSEIWSGASFVHIREQLKKGRYMLDKCKKCDSFHYYF